MHALTNKLETKLKKTRTWRFGRAEPFYMRSYLKNRKTKAAMTVRYGQVPCNTLKENLAKPYLL